FAQDQAEWDISDRVRRGETVTEEQARQIQEYYFSRIPYKITKCRYHSFITYFGLLKRLKWVEPTGQVEPSTFQQSYPPGPPRVFYRLTEAGRQAPMVAWSNPLLTLYKYPVAELRAKRLTKKYYRPRQRRAVPVTPPTPPPTAAAPERPRRRRATPPAPPPPAPPAGPPTEIPAFEVAEKPSRGAAQRLIAHLQKVKKVGLVWPEVKAELERLGGEVSGWASAVEEAADKEDEKEEPDADRLDTLRDRQEELERAVEELEAGGVDAAIEALEKAWPPPTPRRRTPPGLATG
ncbi:MAG: hypothetical protein Q8O40_00080, partial [Chloroflexota bacterium]|nr:hypothetical protein [Chloroflexota bacterium]